MDPGRNIPIMFRLYSWGSLVWGPHFSPFKFVVAGRPNLRQGDRGLSARSLAEVGGSIEAPYYELLSLSWIVGPYS